MYSLFPWPHPHRLTSVGLKRWGGHFSQEGLRCLPVSHTKMSSLTTVEAMTSSTMSKLLLKRFWLLLTMVIIFINPLPDDVYLLPRLQWSPQSCVWSWAHKKGCVPPSELCGALVENTAILQVHVHVHVIVLFVWCDVLMMYNVQGNACTMYCTCSCTPFCLRRSPSLEESLNDLYSIICVG